MTDFPFTLFFPVRVTRQWRRRSVQEDRTMIAISLMLLPMSSTIINSQSSTYRLSYTRKKNGCSGYKVGTTCSVLLCRPRFSSIIYLKKLIEGKQAPCLVATRSAVNSLLQQSVSSTRDGVNWSSGSRLSRKTRSIND